MASKSFLPSAPNKGLWIAAIIIGLIGILVHFVPVEGLSKYNFEMLLVAFILLAIGTTYRKV